MAEVEEFKPVSLKCVHIFNRGAKKGQVCGKFAKEKDLCYNHRVKLSNPNLFNSDGTPKAPKPVKEKKVKEPKPPKEPKAPKEPKPKKEKKPKEDTPKKNRISNMTPILEMTENTTN